MALRHTEVCDQCNRVQSGLDDDYDYRWEGLRLTPFSNEVQRSERKRVEHRVAVPGAWAGLEINEPIEIAISQRVNNRSGHSSKGMGIVLPGLVCSFTCFEAWMKKQMDTLRKEVDPSLRPVPEGGRRINVKGDITD